VNGTRDAGKSHVDENNAVFESGAFADDVEMNYSGDYPDIVSVSSNEEVSDEEVESLENNKVRSKGTKSDDVEMQDGGDFEVDEEGDEGVEGEEEHEREELTFGELVQRQAPPTAIDVEAELDDDAGAGPLISGISSSIYQIPSGISLSTVLSQALKTNDNDMLESCFHTGDLNIIRTTIQRLDSTLAGTLLQRLAERMASRPGRYGHLLVWVQWTCIAHGGAIAGKTDMLNRMSSLFKIMDQRSSSLPSLLLLKGKLDMLDAQVSLRHTMADRRTNGMDDQELLASVTHYQGVNDDSEVERRERRKKSTNTSRAKSMLDDDEDQEDVIPNGIGSGLESDNDEEEGSEDEAEDENLIDIEAEEYAGSSDAEESLEENEDDEDEDEEDDSDAGGDMADFIADSEEEVSEDEEIATAPPTKKTKLDKKPVGRR
jgi:U3 small nucleolar RNA-associated protein 5